MGAGYSRSLGHHLVVTGVQNREEAHDVLTLRFEDHSVGKTARDAWGNSAHPTARLTDEAEAAIKQVLRQRGSSWSQINNRPIILAYNGRRSFEEGVQHLFGGFASEVGLVDNPMLTPYEWQQSIMRRGGAVASEDPTFGRDRRDE